MNISEKVDKYLNEQFGECTTSIFRDLSLNLKKLLEEGSLDVNERFMNLMAIASTLENQALVQLAKEGLTELQIAPEQIQECAEIAGIMGMNNVYYKFKSYLPTEVKDNYTRAGLRMNSLGKPSTGKQNFEMMSLSVSIVNGCPMCIASHEKALTGLSVSSEKIHDLARLAAVCKGLVSLTKAQKLIGN